MNPVSARPLRVACIPWLLLAAALASCGGSQGTDLVPHRATGLAGSDAPVLTLEGCVVNEQHGPRAGRQVNLVDTQGRVIAQADSDAQGKFWLNFTGAQPVTVAIAHAGGETAQVPAGVEDVWLSFCLMDRSQ